MPQSFNLTSPNPGINSAIQSVRVWLLPGPPFEFPRDPKVAMLGDPGQPPLPQAEVAAAVAHFVIYEGYTVRQNQQALANLFGRGSLDVGPNQTVLTYYQATSLEDLLIRAFPAPGPDN